MKIIQDKIDNLIASIDDTMDQYEEEVPMGIIQNLEIFKDRLNEVKRMVEASEKALDDIGKVLKRING